VRLVRARAPEWNLRPDAVGVMGFSAGGQLAAMSAWTQSPPGLNARDPIDRQNSRPSFSILVYPGPTEHAAFSPDTPPAFLLAGELDRPDISTGLVNLYLDLKRDGASAELHMLAGVGHGFGMRESNAPQVAAWTEMVHAWLDARGFLTPHE
jgi:endo-1,4-beta-xylanase